MRCHVSGQVLPDLETIDRKMLRFMSETSAYAFLSTQEAITDSGLTSDRIGSDDVGVIVGSGTGLSQILLLHQHHHSLFDQMLNLNQLLPLA